jgi:hypothetical protein
MIFQRQAPASVLNGVPQPPQTIYANWISQAISDAAGVDHFDSSFGDVVMNNNGCLAVLGNVNYVG